MIVIAANVNLQYASIPKRHESRMVDCLADLVDAVNAVGFKVSLYLTGVSAERLSATRPGLVEDIRGLARQGMVSVGSHGFSHAVLTVIPPKDRLWQVQWGAEAVRSVFDESTGFFAPEFGYTADAGSDVKRAGEPYVIVRKSKFRFEAFKVEVTGGQLVVLRPAARASNAVKQALMGTRAYPHLDTRHAYFLALDVEYPYFARARTEAHRGLWRAALKSFSTHQSQLVGSWVASQSLSVRHYDPSIPPHHRLLFRGDRDFAFALCRARHAVDRDPSPERIRALLLAENSDASEARLKGYSGTGWDRDADAAIQRALRPNPSGTTTATGGPDPAAA